MAGFFNGFLYGVFFSPPFLVELFFGAPTYILATGRLNQFSQPVPEMEISANLEISTKDSSLTRPIVS